MLAPALDYDAEIALACINAELYAWIGRCAPFGIGNSEPVFVTRSATLAAPVRLIKDKHVCLLLTQTDVQVHTENGPTIPALGWSRGPSESSSWAARCARLNLGQGSIVDILYRIKQNTGPYGNVNPDGLELELCDLRPAAAPQP
jgi:single-stranded-DNA-specific exonuclease